MARKRAKAAPKAFVKIRPSKRKIRPSKRQQPDEETKPESPTPLWDEASRDLAFGHNAKALNLVAAEVLTEQELPLLRIQPDESSSSKPSVSEGVEWNSVFPPLPSADQKEPLEDLIIILPLIMR